MRTIGNILWFLLAGWWLALLYAIALVPLGTRVVNADVAVPGVPGRARVPLKPKVSARLATLIR